MKSNVTHKNNVIIITWYYRNKITRIKNKHLRVFGVFDRITGVWPILYSRDEKR